MAVAVDARSLALGTTTATPVTSFNHAHTVGAGSNRALLYICTINEGNAAQPTGITVVWDSGGANQSMTLLATGQNTSDANHGNGFGGSQVFIFGLRNPASGSKNISVNWTNGNSIGGASISFTGVEQSSDAAAFPNNNNSTGASSTFSLTVTSAVNNWTAFGLISEGFMTSGGGQFANSVNDNLGLYLDDDNFFGYDLTGASTVTLSNTLTTGADWALVGVDVAAVSGGPPPYLPYNPWPQAAPVLAQ